ncbi:Nmd5 protein [Maudiozyma humilis]|uniref:Nmd5 protein n=1 Tax=Maudiozyma humilis TaxID=51915 RepID=A0AAV5RY76_MAUHU|nr:Nmd5 protein [Kazachstania humilis]
MDANALLQCFAHTLDQDFNTRTNAEAQLKTASRTPGFLGACLDIIASAEVPENIKLSASLYFKNKIIYGWIVSEYSTSKNELLNYAVDNDEKPVVKDMLIQTMLACAHNAPHCLKALRPALKTIISEEYPKRHWDTLLPKSLELLSNSDIDVAFVGLICLSEIFRTYRWKENDDRQELESLILEYFPALLTYANDQLMQDGKNMNDQKIGELLKLVTKIYKFVTYHDLPFTLQRPEFFVPWANLFVSIIQHPLPESVMAIADPDERKNNPWVKCKKWSYANLFRLFYRYASTSLSRKFEYNEFKTMFIDEFLPQLLNLLFEQIEQWGSGSIWLSNESLYFILSFLEQAVTQKSPWKLINSHYTVILRHVIFPLLRPTEETLEEFENDPQEYIHRNLELWNDDYSPDIEAISLLITAVNKRGKTTLQPTLEFVIETLQSNVGDFHSISLESAVNIEAALKIFSNIVDKLTSQDSPYASEIEGFMKTFVLPFFGSSYGFLQSRVCEVCSKLGMLEFKDQSTIETIYLGITNCLNDTSDSLPVNLSAALALQTYIQDPYFQQAIAPSVVPIMQKLLTLSNEFESDSISGVMQEFVEQFSNQLQPFGVELINNLIQQFLKLAIDLNDAANIDPTSLMNGDVPDESGKQMAALGILSTIISILLSFENSKEIVRSLEQSFYSVAEFILKNDIDDFYREVCEFYENSTFLLREISPVTWKVLELIGESNRKDESMIAYYLEDFMLIFNNVLVYGSDELKKNDFYCRIFYEIYANTGVNEDSDFDELNTIFDFSQKVILALGQQVPQTNREAFLNDATSSLALNKGSLKSNIVFGVTTFNVIIASCISAPLETLQYVHAKGFFNMFFDTWLTSYAANYKRTYDIKLSIMALLSITGGVDASQLSALGVDTILSSIGSTLSQLICKYPQAELELKAKRQEFSSSGFETDFQNNWDDTVELNDDDEEGGADEDNFETLLEELKKQQDGISFVDGISFGDEETFDDLEEDPLTKSILDDIDIISLFKNSVELLQQNNTSIYNVAFGSVTPEQQQQLSRVLGA